MWKDKIKPPVDFSRGYNDATTIIPVKVNSYEELLSDCQEIAKTESSWKTVDSIRGWKPEYVGIWLGVWWDKWNYDWECFVADVMPLSYYTERFKEDITYTEEEHKKEVEDYNNKMENYNNCIVEIEKVMEEGE